MFIFPLSAVSNPAKGVAAPLGTPVGTSDTAAPRTLGRRLGLVAALLMALGTGNAARAADFVVTNTGDNGGVNPAVNAGTGTLRQAIINANATTVADAITFDGAVFGAGQSEANRTITVADDLPDITRRLSITGTAGTGAGVIIRGANQNIDIFTVGTTSNLIVDFDRLTIRDCRIGIFTDGGIGGIVTVSNSTLSGNVDTAIDSVVTLTVSNSTLSGNGIGISNGNSTFTVLNSTLSGNSTGILSDTSFSGSTTLRNSLVVGNTSANVNGSFNGDGNRTTGTAAEAGLETTLRDNGGPTQTLALSASSPAVNAGVNGNVPGTTAFDQRGAGFPRIVSTTVDIGAYEVQPPTISSFTPASGPIGSNVVITGTNFLGATGVSFNGTAAAFTVNSNTQITAVVPNGAAVGTAGTISVTTRIGTATSAGTFTPTERRSLVVNTATDNSTNIDGATSLREAIAFANSDGVASAITFDGTVFGSAQSAANRTISVAVGLPEITAPVSITGSAGGVIISATTKDFNIFTVNAGVSGGVSADFDRLTISNGEIGIENFGTITVLNSTLNSNDDGISNTSTGTVLNSTLSGNDFGIFNTGTLTVLNSTLSGNANGIGNFGNGIRTLRNSLVVGNTNSNVNTSFTGDGNRTTGTAAESGLDTVLKSNGGPTPTLALFAGSVAINGGVNGNVPGGVSFDQRGSGFARIVNTTVDIGAFEFVALPPTISNFTPTSGPLGTSVILTGTSFTGTTSVRFNGTAAAFTVGSDTQITAVVPSGATTGTLSVTTAGGTATSTGTFTVMESPSLVVTTNRDDSTNLDGVTSLREAITFANSAASGANPGISFASTVRGEILLGAVLPTLSKGMSITGPGASLLTIRPTTPLLFTFVVFNNNTGVISTLSGLTISGGNRGISNSGTLALLGCIVTGNGSGTTGGGINNTSGTLRMTGCVVSDNTARTNGGGIFSNGGSVSMLGCTVSGNTITSNGSALGGGIYAISAVVTLTGCTVSGNTATAAGTSGNGRGGGIHVTGASATLNASNCTVFGNTATTIGTSASNQGGGIYLASGSVTLANCSVSGNTAKDFGGGISRAGGTFNVRNTIVAGNTSAEPDVSGAFVSQGSNLIGDQGTFSGGFTNGLNGDQVGGGLDSNDNPIAVKSAGFDPAGFKNYGGPTETLALATGSTAINAGNNTLIPADTLNSDGDTDTTETLPFDQRGTGFARISNTTVDIGAFEVQIPVFSNASYNFIFTQNRAIMGARVRATDADGDAVTYSLSGGALPAGIVFNSDGTFSGTPTATSDAITRTVTASDGNGGTATASVTIQVSPGTGTSGGVIISEFRFHGATSDDEYVEIHNTTDAAINIGGWKLRTNTGTAGTPGFQTATVGGGTMIPARGHFLFTGPGYAAGALLSYGASNASLGDNASPDSGALLLNAGDVVQDAVGFGTSFLSLREGAGLPSAPDVAGQYAFMRDFMGQFAKDSGDSSNDFVFVSTLRSPTAVSVSGTNGAIPAQLGAPSPEGLASPTLANTLLSVALLDPQTPQNNAPNRVRTGGVNTGNLLIRRTLTNNSQRAITKLRMQVTLITGQGSPPNITAGQADVRLIGQDTEPVTVQGQSVTVFGTALEAPSTTTTTTGSAPNTVVMGGGGGLGSSLAFDLVLATPLQPNRSRAYAFNLQVAQSGNFVVVFNILANTQPATP